MMFYSTEKCRCESVYCGGECLLDLSGPGYRATRSSDVLRRIPFLKESGIEVGITLATLSHSLSAKLEPGAPSPRHRLEILSRLSAEGISCGLEICPVLPGITDRLATLRNAVQAAARCGATWVRAHGLRLPTAAKPAFFRFLKLERRGLVRRYQARYRGTAEPPRLWSEGLAAMMEELRVEAGLLSRPPVSGPAGQLSLPFAVAERRMEYSGRLGSPGIRPQLVAR
jgi:hypothetical protein